MASLPTSNLLRRGLSALLLVLMLALPASAQVAWDASGGCNQYGTSVTCSFTTSGANRLLVVQIAMDPGTDPSTATCTYNSVSMSTTFNDYSNTNRPVAVRHLVAPATGANNIVCSEGGNRAWAVNAASFTGVNQTTPMGSQSVQDGSGGGTSGSVSISSATGDMVLGFLVTTNGVTDAAPGASATVVRTQFSDGDGQNMSGMSYWTGASSRSMSWSWTAFANYMVWGINIAQASGGGGPTCIGALSLLGVSKCG